MKYRKSMIIIMLAIFLFSIASVCASEIDTPLASDEMGQMELSANDEVIEDNMQTGEENPSFALNDNEETLSVETDTDVLGADEGTYSGLADEISKSGNITLTHKNYIYDDGAAPITITEPNKVIDGNGAVIDMFGSTIRVFNVSASGVTIKNLTIKNANYDANGGAIYFNESGTVINCNFTNNIASEDGGAVWMTSGSMTDCNFINNFASRGGAVCFYEKGNLTNCNFKNNSAETGGAVFIETDYSNSKILSTFINNSAYRGGAIFFNGETDNNVINGYFKGNEAERIGGAICFQNKSFDNVISAEFYDNRANATSGGAIFFNSLSENNSFESIFTNNYALYGGAVFFYKNANYIFLI